MDQALKFGTIDLEKMEARVWIGELGGKSGMVLSHRSLPLSLNLYFLHFTFLPMYNYIIAYDIHNIIKTRLATK